MDNFEDRFLEELAKARARLEGKVAYDDESIKNEFDPDFVPEKTDAAAPPKKEKPAKAKVSEEKCAADEIKTAAPTVSAEKTAEVKRSSASEKAAVIWGGITVVMSLVISGLVQFVNNTSDTWTAIKSYLPFIGIVCGAAAVISGALLIKNNKKGVKPLVLGLIAIIIAAILPAL